MYHYPVAPILLLFFSGCSLQITGSRIRKEFSVSNCNSTTSESPNQTAGSDGRGGGEGLTLLDVVLHVSWLKWDAWAHESKWTTVWRYPKCRAKIYCCTSLLVIADQVTLIMNGLRLVLAPNGGLLSIIFMFRSENLEDFRRILLKNLAETTDNRRDHKTAPSLKGFENARKRVLRAWFELFPDATYVLIWFGIGSSSFQFCRGGVQCSNVRRLRQGAFYIL